MKYKDNGQWKEIYVKALDSMPVGTEVDFDGQASDIPVGWEQVDDTPVYSTTERRIGTYNNKPLYAKIFEGTTSQTNTVLLASNIAKVIDNKGFLMQDSQYALSFPVISGGTSYARIYTDTINHECYLQFSNDYRGKTYEITIEYTKTTD